MPNHDRICAQCGEALADLLAEIGPNTYTGSQAAVRTARAALALAKEERVHGNAARRKACFERYREVAAATYGDEGRIEIDPDAEVSLSPGQGAYVQAWVWVYRDEVKRSTS